MPLPTICGLRASTPSSCCSTRAASSPCRRTRARSIRAPACLGRDRRHRPSAAPVHQTWSSAGTPTAPTTACCPNSDEQLIPVSSASSFGRLVTDIDMTLNTSSGKPTSISVDNKIVFRDDQDAAAAALVSYYQTAVAPIANVVVGSITADILGTGAGSSNAAGESALGDVIADAQLAYTQSAGAQLAFMNPGGIRANLSFASVASRRRRRSRHVRRSVRRPAVQQPRRDPGHDRRADQGCPRTAVGCLHAAGPVRWRNGDPAGLGQVHVLLQRDAGLRQQDLQHDAERQRRSFRARPTR